MQVIFPNPYGFKLPEMARIQAMQKQYAFSNEYANFLQIQNGFSFDSLENCSDDERHLSVGEEVSDGNSDLRVLYGLDSDDPYYELTDACEEFSLFQGLFFPIGVGYGGNDYVEILAGRFKGYIASLDHDMYACCDSIEDYIKDMELDGFQDLSLDEKANVLADDELGLVWFHAGSMKEFTDSCIYCDDGYSGFVRDAESLQESVA